MPTGKVKWFDAERGFGFACVVARFELDDGVDVGAEVGVRQADDDG